MPFTIEFVFTGIFHFKKTKKKGICEITEGVFSEVYSQTDLHVSSGHPTTISSKIRSKQF